ncbi:MAG: hypothetical protein JO171_13825, partial [Paludibacterium sp.]|uniref:hypothetical protein n=1 Tax=Paludibacterium sp. TaxID=1917523 RepID=UPI0025E4477F
MKLASQVLRLQGEVFAVDAAGRRRRLRPFDRVAADERLAFAEGAQVWLLRDDGKSVLLTGDTPPTEVSPPPGPDTRHALAEAAPAPRVKRALRLTDAPPPDGEEGHGGFSVVFLTRIQERVPNSPLWWPGADDAESVHEQALPTWAGAAEQSLMGRGFSLVEPSDGIGRRDVTNARATVQSEEEKFMRQTETANQNEPAEIEEGEFMLT